MVRENSPLKGDHQVAQLLKEKGDAIRRAFHPQEMVLFGSRARGEARPESDIDLIISSSAFRDVRLVNRMALFLNTVKYPKHIDAICLTPEELEQRKKNPLFLELYRSGIPLDI